MATDGRGSASDLRRGSPLRADFHDLFEGSRFPKLLRFEVRDGSLLEFDVKVLEVLLISCTLVVEFQSLRGRPKITSVPFSLGLV